MKAVSSLEGYLHISHADDFRAKRKQHLEQEPLMSTSLKTSICKPQALTTCLSSISFLSMMSVILLPFTQIIHPNPDTTVVLTEALRIGENYFLDNTLKYWEADEKCGGPIWAEPYICCCQCCAKTQGVTKCKQSRGTGKVLIPAPKTAEMFYSVMVEMWIPQRHYTLLPARSWILQVTLPTGVKMTVCSQVHFLH